MIRPLRTSDDRGASLVMALVVVTVFSVVIAALLSFADTSLRATIVLRGQSADTESANAAADLAINELRRGTYDGTGQCFTSSNTLTLTNYYQPGSGAADSAVVTCELDSGHSGSSPIDINPSNKPANAILTLGTSGTETGLHVDVADGRDFTVRGSIFSNSTINVPRGSITSTGALTARNACTGTISSTPSPVCNAGAGPMTEGDDPNYAAPTGSQTVRTPPFCSSAAVLTFSPGLYNDVDVLNNVTRCPGSILHFTPGTYYFDFGDSVVWTVNNAYIVGGTPTAALSIASPPTMPGSCRSPLPPVPADPSWTPPGPGAGVTFVFGKGAHMQIGKSQVELCGSYSTSQPPIVLYGMKTTVGAVSAQTGCVVATPYPSSGCAVIKSLDTTSRFYIQGTIYVPRSAVDVALTNPVGLMASAGIIARTIRITPAASSVLTDPVVEVPASAPIGRRTLIYLTVYVCPGASTCDTTAGLRRIRLKVGILDPTGTAVAGRRQVTVYSWSIQQ